MREIIHGVNDLELKKSRMTSHCEIILSFCLSASHPMKLSSQSQKWRAFPQTSAERFTFLPAFESNVPFLNAIGSGLLTFFSSLVIQESLINCASERLRSKKTSQSEVFLTSVFLLHILFSWVRARSFRVPFRQLSARPYRTLALISVKGRKLTTRPHILLFIPATSNTKIFFQA